MKNIKKTLMAGLLACAAFNAQAEVDPFSWGAKLGPSLSFARGYNDIQINGNKVDGKVFDTFWGHGGLYAEYAFTDYAGVGLEVGYMKLGSTLEAKKDTNNENNKDSASSIGMTSHGIAFPVHVQFYPLGREEESGILKINVGVTPYVPFSTTCTKDGKKMDDLTSEKNNEFPSYRLALHGGVGYEFPFGLAIDAKYAFGLCEKFSLPSGSTTTTIFEGATNVKSLSTHHVTLGVGFNFMSLMTE